MTYRTCELCGDTITETNKVGVCRRNPECLKESRRRRWQIWYQDNKDYLKSKRVYGTKELELQRRYRKNNPLVRYLQSAKQRANLRGVPFDLTVEDLPPVPDVSPIFGEPVTFWVGRGTLKRGDKGKVLSLDCIVPSLGYIPGNVQWLSHRENTMKNDATMEELVLFGEWAARQLANNLVGIAA